MNCDAFAPFYQACERLAFGKRLSRHRAAFVHAAAGARTALVLGDGDGKFLAQLQQAYPNLLIDAIDISGRMLALARRRLARTPATNVRFFQDDALRMVFPRPCYDIVYSHFFLDCFTTAQVFALAAKIRAVCAPSASWIISDFQQVQRGWRKLFTALWLKTMYIFFRVTTHLAPQQLPDFEKALRKYGFALHQKRSSMAELVTSQWWRLH